MKVDKTSVLVGTALGAAAAGVSVFVGLAWAEVVPPLVLATGLGAVIASIISVAGVFAANRASADRLAIQLANDRTLTESAQKHDAAQKRADRAIANKRDVYMDAVEKVQAAMLHIGNISDVPFGEDVDSSPLRDLLASVSKVWVVAEAPAAALSRKLPEIFTRALVETMISTQEYRQAKLERAADPKRLRLWKAELALAHIRRMRPALELIAKLVCLLRAELELETDQEAFEALEVQQADKAEAFVQTLIDAIQRGDLAVLTPSANQI